MSLPNNRNLFAEFKGDNRILVETGSFRGDGIAAALEAGYERVYSIDIDSESIKFCKNRFNLYQIPDPRVQLFTGDSAEILSDVINGIEHPITFWIDSHWQLTEDSEPGDNPFPLLKELDQIAWHPIKTHTIIIDDLLYLTHPDITGWTKERVIKKILEINNNYIITLFSNPVINNILVAHV